MLITKIKIKKIWEIFTDFQQAENGRKTVKTNFKSLVASGFE